MACPDYLSWRKEEEIRKLYLDGQKRIYRDIKECQRRKVRRRKCID